MFHNLVKRLLSPVDFRASGDNLHAFVLLRVGLSGILLFKLLYELPDFGDLYGPNGIVPWWANEISAPSYVPTLSWICSVVNSFGRPLDPETVAVTAQGAYAAALVLLLAGHCQRVAAVTVWLLHFVFLSSNRFTLYGVDAFANIGLFFLMLAPSTANRTRTGGLDVSLWPLLLSTLLRIQICVMYAETGWAKAIGPQWWSGDSLWRALQQPQFQAVVGTQWLGSYPTVVKVIGISVIVVEIAYPFVIWIRKVRLIELILILIFHLTIMLTLGLWAFGATAIVLNLSAFGIAALQDLRSILAFRRPSTGFNDVVLSRSIPGIDDEKRGTVTCGKVGCLLTSRAPEGDELR
jgi:hypothetical protein